MLLNTLRQDVALALRTLRRGRLVSLVAVLSLAIGIAANTTVFSLVQALEFPRLIYPDASRLVFLETRNQPRGIDEMMISEPDARDLAAASRTLEGMSISAQQSSILRVGDSARRAKHASSYCRHPHQIEETGLDAASLHVQAICSQRSPCRCSPFSPAGDQRVPRRASSR